MRYAFLTYLALIALTGCATLFLTLRDAPTVNRALRIVGEDGRWDVPDRTSHYDTARYLFNRGFALLNPDEFAVDPLADNFDIPDEAEMARRVQLAVVVLQKSVRANPSNAHAWANLALAQALEGEPDAAQFSLTQSWRLAPNNLQLAELRLFTVSLILPPQNTLDAYFTSGIVADVQQDVSVLASFSPDSVTPLAQSMPGLSAMIPAD